MTITFLGQVLVRGKFVVDNQCLQVQNFKYLSCEISYENEKAIQQKLAKFAQMLGILNIKLTLVQKFSRIGLYNAFAFPILLYGSEIWTLRKKDENN